MKRFLNKDWCTLFPDRVWSFILWKKVYIGDICYLHDIRYGKQDKSRWTADLELFNDVKRRGLPVTAFLMWAGVRLVGWYWFSKRPSQSSSDA